MGVMGSDFLFVRPSLFHGLARTLDLWGALSLYNWSRSGEESDARGIWLDWAQIDADLNAAIGQFKSEYDKQRTLFEDAERSAPVLASSENE